MNQCKSEYGTWNIGPIAWKRNRTNPSCICITTSSNATTGRSTDGSKNFENSYNMKTIQLFDHRILPSQYVWLQHGLFCDRFYQIVEDTTKAKKQPRKFHALCERHHTTPVIALLKYHCIVPAL